MTKQEHYNNGGYFFCKREENKNGKIIFSIYVSKEFGSWKKWSTFGSEQECNEMIKKIVAIDKNCIYEE